MSVRPIHSDDFRVRCALQSAWSVMLSHVRPVEGIPQLTPKQIDQVVHELRHRYIPALEALRDRGHKVPQPRCEHPPLRMQFEGRTPMTDALDVMDLIEESKEGPP